MENKQLADEGTGASCSNLGYRFFIRLILKEGEKTDDIQLGQKKEARTNLFLQFFLDLLVIILVFSSGLSLLQSPKAGLQLVANNLVHLVILLQSEAVSSQEFNALGTEREREKMEKVFCNKKS